MRSRTPVDALGQPIVADAIYVSVTSWIGADSFTAVKHGARRRGDDPDVLARPSWWLPDGVDDRTLASATIQVESVEL